MMGFRHCADVVHALFERRIADVPVGRARTALVEHDDTRERGEPFHPVAEPDLAPVEVDVRNETRHDHEIDRAIAEDLVGDVDVAAEGVSGFGDGSGHRC